MKRPRPPTASPINVTGARTQQQLYRCPDCGASVTYGSLRAIGGGPGHLSTCSRQHHSKDRSNTDAATEIARVCRERDEALEAIAVKDEEIVLLRERLGDVDPEEVTSC